MADILFSLLLSLASAGVLLWTVVKRRTISRGVWRPSIERDEHPVQYWTEVVWTALFTIITFGIVMHFVTRY